MIWRSTMIEDQICCWKFAVGTTGKDERKENACISSGDVPLHVEVYWQPRELAILRRGLVDKVFALLAKPT
jgi:hypothetical protein